MVSSLSPCMNTALACTVLAGLPMSTQDIGIAAVMRGSGHSQTGKTPAATGALVTGLPAAG